MVEAILKAPIYSKGCCKGLYMTRILESLRFSAFKQAMLVVVLLVIRSRTSDNVIGARFGL